MNVHSYNYGPAGGNGLKYTDTPNLLNIVSEDVIRRLYTQESRRPIVDKQLYNTPKGLVVAVTFIEPTRSHDHRATYQNKTFFIRLSEVVDELAELLEDKQAATPFQLKIVQDGGK